jgi:trypsin
VIGAHDRRDRGDKVEVHQAEKIIVHPKYNGITNDYDFALVKIKKESKYTPVQINRTELDGLNLMFTVIGWGVTREGYFRLPEKLQKVDVPNVSQKDCQASYGVDRITESMICAGYKEGLKDSCQGDSGGPMIEYRSGVPFLVGAVSWGIGCARPEKYGVYAKVSAVQEWIDTLLKDE